jgi:hypothetical protein
MKPDIKKLQAIGVELRRCLSTLETMEPGVAKADMMRRIDALVDENARTLGLPDDEIARINEEAEGDDYIEIIEGILGQKPVM